ncbi:MAG: T9SS type A sorting domain-containing protein, partial [Chitinophagaceae bacterium]|nr:T9SS type A sorting domain-containing protein [Chitinophagaceae bacterium]
LPFDLFKFTGKAVNNDAKLEWIVNNQSDVLSYTIERSIDNINFEEAGTVDAKNSNAANITYNFTDFNAGNIAKVVYYRVHSNEVTGVRKYTNIISVNFGDFRDVYVSVFPNPVTDKTTVLINALTDETAQLNLVDNTGRIVHKMVVNLVRGNNSIQLDMSKFNSGLYYLDITGKTISQKIKLIKQ